MQEPDDNLNEKKPMRYATYHYRDYGPAQKEGILKLHEQGLSQTKIARLTDTSLNAIRMILQESGCYKSRKKGGRHDRGPHKVSTLRLAYKAQRLADERGMRNAEIAVLLGFTESRIWQVNRIDVEASMIRMGLDGIPEAWRAEKLK